MADFAFTSYSPLLSQARKGKNFEVHRGKKIFVLLVLFDQKHKPNWNKAPGIKFSQISKAGTNTEAIRFGLSKKKHPVVSKRARRSCGLEVQSS